MPPPSTIGPHELYIEHDVLFVRPHGAMTLEQVETASDLLYELARTRGSVFYLMDLTDMAPPSPEVRRWHTTMEGDPRIKAVVAFGVSTPMRLLIRMLQRAIALLGRPQKTSFVVLRDEVEARAWIAAQRTAGDTA